MYPLRPMPVRSSLRPQHVIPRPLRAVTELLGLAMPDNADVEITGVIHDSRQVRPGDLYAALPGATTHGAAFVAEAASAGAVAVLTDPAGADSTGSLPTVVVDNPRARLGRIAAYVYGEPARDLLMLGITGTNGKTTTAYLMESGLRAAGHVTGLVGTVETRVGDERFPSVRTTPEATELHALLAVMRERGATACVMEVSSHALVLGRVDGIVFDVAGFTNLSEDHLDFHDDLDDYFAAKAGLFTVAAVPSWRRHGRRRVRTAAGGPGRDTDRDCVDAPSCGLERRRAGSRRVAGRHRVTSSTDPAIGCGSDRRYQATSTWPMRCSQPSCSTRRGSTDPLRFAASRHVPVFLAAWSGS